MQKEGRLARRIQYLCASNVAPSGQRKKGMHFSRRVYESTSGGFGTVPVKELA